MSDDGKCPAKTVDCCCCVKNQVSDDGKCPAKTVDLVGSILLNQQCTAQVEVPLRADDDSCFFSNDFQ